jgi:t-SNARE complex subunit (syntaxin)
VAGAAGRVAGDAVAAVDDAGARLLDVGVVVIVVVVVVVVVDDVLVVPLATRGPQQDSDDDQGAVPSAL